MKQLAFLERHGYITSRLLDMIEKDEGEDQQGVLSGGGTVDGQLPTSPQGQAPTPLSCYSERKATIWNSGETSSSEQKDSPSLPTAYCSVSTINLCTSPPR